MRRTIMDDELRTWEAFATTGDYGFPDRSRVLFRCVSDPGERARAAVLEGDKSDAEHAVRGRTDAELKALLANAREIG